MSDVEKLANYDKLKTELEKEKSKSEYWKNEHFVLSSNHTKQAKEIKELKKENERQIEEMKEDIAFCLVAIDQEAEMSTDERTRSEMETCSRILSRWCK